MTLQTHTTAQSDETLAQRARGNSAAFAELYSRHFDRVYRYHYIRTGNIADAQDLTTQTFLAALEGIASYRTQGSFAAWLLGIARHKAAMLYRSKRPQVSLESIAEIIDPVRHTETQVEQRMDIAYIHQSLNKINPERAEALQLCIFGELTAADAGQVMKKSAAAVKMLVYRGLKELRENRILKFQEEA